MDFLTFFIRLIEALAWPAAAVIIVIIFRREVQALVPLVRKLKAGPLEAEFERAVREISQEASVGPGPELELVISPEQELLLEVARRNPRTAIVEAWQRIKQAARRVELAKMTSLAPSGAVSPLETMEILVKNGAINPEEFALFHNLRSLRNQVAHIEDFSPSRDAASRYVELAIQLESRLELLPHKNNTPIS